MADEKKSVRAQEVYGAISFRTAACYAGCKLGDGLFHRMIALVYGVVEDHN